MTFQILDDEISADFFVAVPEMLPKLLPLKNKLRKRFPKGNRGKLRPQIIWQPIILCLAKLKSNLEDSWTREELSFTEVKAVFISVCHNKEHQFSFLSYHLQSFKVNFQISLWLQKTWVIFFSISLLLTLRLSRHQHSQDVGVVQNRSWVHGGEWLLHQDPDSNGTSQQADADCGLWRQLFMTVNTSSVTFTNSR